MIWILRPLTPPAALISSAASCAACGIDEPATAVASAMTPILIGPFDWALAGPASVSATSAPPAASAAKPLSSLLMELPPLTIAAGFIDSRCLEASLSDRLWTASPEPAAPQGRAHGHAPNLSRPGWAALSRDDRTTYPVWVRLSFL